MIQVYLGITLPKMIHFKNQNNDPYALFIRKFKRMERSELPFHKSVTML